MLISSKDDDESLCVAKSPIRLRMQYFRKVYFILAVQQLILAAAAFVLFMTSGVRPFVQYYTSIIWSTALVVIVSFFCLRHAANHAPRLAGLCFFLFTFVLSLACVVATAYLDTEIIYTVCAINGGIFLLHSIYCVQTLRSLRFMPSSLITIILVVLEVCCLQSVVVMLNPDYLSIIILFSSAICIYVHWNIGYFSQILTSKETVLGCVSVFISFPKLY